MPLTNSQYDSIIRKYELKQNNNRYRLEERSREIHRNIPEYEQLEHMVASVSVEHGKKLLLGDESALSALKLRLADLTKRKKELLISHGYPANYLEAVYSCPLCKDTGYTPEGKCRCFKQEIINILYEQSNIQEVLQQENFQTLSYEYYRGKDLENFRATVQTAQNFIKNFNSDYHNLFFYGTVGTGKSFLSNCIAKELIQKGNSVLYFSAIGLFDLLSRNTFDYKAKDELASLYDDLYHCDLLIIDDLGTELTTSFTSSQLFSCMNERHLRKKSTLISTNLSLEDLGNRYADRIFSRITSNYELCKFSGQDIRMYKKRTMNRK